MPWNEDFTFKIIVQILNQNGIDMKHSRSTTEGYQAAELREAPLNNRSGRSSLPSSTGTPISKSSLITSDPETPSDAVNERDQEIQEEKIHDVSERNDTMHNPAMEIGKSYVVTVDNENEIKMPQENPNK